MKFVFYYVITGTSRANRSERTNQEKENQLALEPKESASKECCRSSMTSPKISADKANANASSAVKQDVSEASNGNATAGTSADSVASSAESTPGIGPSGVFSWLKVFRFANLMIKQGC